MDATDSIGPSRGELAPHTPVGEYRIERKLGQGGMGAVYLAVLPVLGKRVAVKVLAPALSDSQEFAQRFLNEARAAVRIGHRNIVDVFAFDRLPDGRLYYVMEFLEGRTLASRLTAGDLDGPELRRLLAEICDALAAAHAHGVVHRDLKPENIWIAQPARGPSYTKILDFGIAKIHGSDKLTETGTPMGTPRYMAPEQCRGRGVDHRADIYSLGVILYEVFTGRLPFEAQSAPDFMLAHILNAPPPPSTHRPLPAALERVILDCLAKEADQRPQSAAEVARRLDAALADAAPAPQARAAPASAADVAAAALTGTAPASTLRPQALTAGPATRALADEVLARRRRRTVWGLGVTAALAVAAGAAWRLSAGAAPGLPGASAPPATVAGGVDVAPAPGFAQAASVPRADAGLAAVASTPVPAAAAPAEPAGATAPPAARRSGHRPRAATPSPPTEPPAPAPVVASSPAPPPASAAPPASGATTAPAPAAPSAPATGEAAPPPSRAQREGLVEEYQP